MKLVHVIALAVWLITCLSLHTQARDPQADFTKADSVAQLYAGHSLNSLQTLSRKLTCNLATEQEKFRAIFKWVCSNITSDHDLYSINKQKRETLIGEPLIAWNRSFSKIVLTKLINSHTTVCTGYAYLIRELSLYAGLSCEIINGYGRNVISNIGGSGMLNHSWNAVKLDEKWYLCDATWASGAIDPEKKSFVAKFNEAYFLSDPTLFLSNHYPQDIHWTLLEKSPSLQEFLNAPLSYVAAIREHVEAVCPFSFQLKLAKGSELTLAFIGPADLQNKLSLAVNANRKAPTIIVKSMPNGQTQYTLNQVFYLKGNYAVHVLFNNDYLYSYNVIVTK